MTGTAEQTAALTLEQRNELHERLLDYREATAEYVARLVADLTSFEGSRRDTPVDDEHDPEGPTLAFERSQSSAILGQTREHLSQIESALQRVNDGDYGVCATCKRPIPLARLEVRPYSTQCVSCAAKARA